MRYLYCPKCGTKLIGKAAGDDGDVPFCTSCNRYWFDRFSCCVIVLVANEYNELAMIRQYRLSERYWTYVAGFIIPGETAEEAARREVKEELGLELNRLEYGGTYWFADHEQLMHRFIGFTRKKDFVLSSEVNEAEWVPASEALSKMFPARPRNTLQPLFHKYEEICAQKS